MAKEKQNHIGFSSKQEHVYTRFQNMRRAYADAHGRTYAPGFLTVLLDNYEAVSKLIDHVSPLKAGWAGTDPDEFLRKHGYRTELEPENE